MSFELVLGACALAFWKTKSRRAAAPSSTQVVAAAAPSEMPRASRLPSELWMPTSPAELEPLLDTARTWLRLVPDVRARDLERVVRTSRTPAPELVLPFRGHGG